MEFGYETSRKVWRQAPFYRAAVYYASASRIIAAAAMTRVRQFGRPCQHARQNVADFRGVFVDNGYVPRL
jgi:hypothetical protein